MSKFYHGVATCNGGKFCSEFFTQAFVHILGAEHSDLGIIGKDLVHLQAAIALIHQILNLFDHEKNIFIFSQP